MKQLVAFLFFVSLNLFSPQLNYAQATSKVIVPAYFFPYDNANPGAHNVGPYWSSLIDAAKFHGNKLIVVANPNNGPGSGTGWEKQKYAEAINKVRSHGAIVVGYVYTCYGLTSNSTACNGRTLSHVTNDITKWKQWFGVDGIFLDEAATDPNKVGIYQSIDQDIQSQISNALVISNYGTMPANQYLSRRGVHVIMENTAAFFDTNHNQLNNPPAGSAALIHTMNDGNWQSRRNALNNKGIKYYFLTGDGGWNPWDTLPVYFNNLF